MHDGDYEVRLKGIENIGEDQLQYEFTVDTTAPNITNAGVTDTPTSSGVTLSGVTIQDPNFDTSASGAQVIYGASGSALTGSVTIPGSFSGYTFTASSLTLSGLQSSTDYQYQIRARDRAGNVTNSATGSFQTAAAGGGQGGGGNGGGTTAGGNSEKSPLKVTFSNS